MNSNLKFLTFAAIFAIGAGTLAGAQDAISSEKKQETKHDQVAATTSHGAEAVEKESGQGTTAVKNRKETGGHGIKWGYEGQTGPGNWATLPADYELCGRGTLPSPIDLSGMSTATVEPIAFDYNLTPLDVVHNGHTVQVNYQPGSSITVGGKRYELLQYHFHSPSEHSVAGRPLFKEDLRDA